jgi:demethylspheroidene O-methyltransferase
MAASQSFIAHEVLAAVDFSAFRRLLDVGGGTGAFVEAVGRVHPNLELGLADLPPVAEAAQARLAGTSLAGRVRCSGVDFFAQPLPTDADVVTLVRILHDHDDADALALLRAVRRALPEDGRLVIAEPMRGEPSAERIGDVYFPLYFLAMGRGRSRNRDELMALCREAGFTTFSHPSTHVPLQTSVIVARGGAADPLGGAVSGTVDERSVGIG